MKRLSLTSAFLILLLYDSAISLVKGLLPKAHVYATYPTNQGNRIFTRTTLHSTPSPFSSTPFLESREFYSIDGCYVMFPQDKVPKSVIHFIGGFVAGSIVNVAYASLLSNLAANGHLIVATPIPAVSIMHGEVAYASSKLFTECYYNKICPIIGPAAKSVPVVGLSHSLGGKLMVLLNSRKEDRKIIPSRAANVFLAFNNAGMQENLDIMGNQASKISPEMSKVFDVLKSGDLQRMYKSIYNSAVSRVREATKSTDAWSEVADILGGQMEKLSNVISQQVSQQVNGLENVDFVPNSEETWNLLLQGYNVQRNHLICFQDDTLDQSTELSSFLRRRGCDVKTLKLNGNHLTPNTLTSGSGEEIDKNFVKELNKLFNAIARDAMIEFADREREQYRLPPAESRYDNDNF